MRRTSVLEAVDVVLGTSTLGVDRWVVLAHLRREQGRVVDTLSTRANFLAAHEHVVRVGKERVGGRRHGVGGTDGEGKLVERVEVRVVLFEDKFAELLLLWGTVQLLDVLRKAIDTGSLRQVVVVVELLSSFA
jgi:hypothetical protein